MTRTPVIGRFAPSPTGPLHLGSMVAAIASFVDARAAGGQWRLRIDNLDSTRCRPAWATSICSTLEAFGLHWDGAVQNQDSRRGLYAETLDQLIERRRAYPCGCTRREVQSLGRPGPAGLIYPGTCRGGLPPGRTARSWRFRAESQPVAFLDRCHGHQTVAVDELVGDFLLKRGDGLHAYPLAMVVDDAELEVTDIVRGADLLPATAPQVALQRELGLPTPRYLHVPVATDELGRKLSKTNAATAVDPRQASAITAAVLAFLAHPPPAEFDGAPPGELLEWAVRHWRPVRLQSRPGEEAFLLPHPL